MAANESVKVGPEFYVYVATTGTVTIDPDTGIATEGTLTNAPAWTLVSFSRTPISWSEPQVIVDVYKNFKIDHTKKGRQQRKTLSIRKAYTNMAQSFRQYMGLDLLVKLEIHPDDQTNADEKIYFRSVRILTPSWEIPDEEGTESIECVYAESGYSEPPAA